MPGASHLYASLTCSGALGEALGSSNYNFRSCLENHRFSFSLYMFSRFWHAKTSTYPPGPPGRAVVRSNFVRTWLQLTHWCPRWCQAVSHPTKKSGMLEIWIDTDISRASLEIKSQQIISSFTFPSTLVPVTWPWRSWWPSFRICASWVLDTSNEQACMKHYLAVHFKVVRFWQTTII